MSVAENNPLIHAGLGHLLSLQPRCFCLGVSLTSCLSGVADLADIRVNSHLIFKKEDVTVAPRDITFVTLAQDGVGARK